MTRVRHVLIIALPSLLVGGLLFGFWPAAADNRDPWLHAQPAPPAPPRPPTPPTPPTPRPGPTPRPAGGVSVKLHDGKITVEGVTDMVRKQLDSVSEMVRNSPDIPPQVRANVMARLERVRNSIERRLSRIKSTDIGKLGEEMERVGEDLEEAMTGLDEDLGRLGKQLAKQFGKEWKKQWKQGQIQRHSDDGREDEEDEEAEAMPPVDPEDARAAIADVRGIALQPQQRLQIQRLREASEREIAQAETQLATLSNKLEQALANPKVSDDEVRRYVDSISQTEATIRKARLLAWVGARRVLDEQQRTKIEGAARQRSRQR